MALVLQARHTGGTQVQCVITPAGGTIGRVVTNTLVLSDPERAVSRVHAQVVFRNGQYFIIDRGSNPTCLNGSPLGSENEAPLRTGDKLTIGAYEITVSMTDEASALPSAHSMPPVSGVQLPDDDPFADLLNEFKPAIVQTSTPQSADYAIPVPDPLGQSAASAHDPFADLLAPVAADSPAPQLGDFDFMPEHKESSLDELFGLGESHGKAAEPRFDDPFAGTPLGEPSSQPNMAQALDPLVALGTPPKAPPAALPDNVPGVQFAFTPPPAQASSVPSSSAPPPPPPPSAPPTRPSPTLSAAPSGAPSVAQPSVPPARVSDDMLLEAFLAGLGPSNATPDRLTPELMQRIGSLLRHATQGAVQLLHTRQEVKRELRAEMTMIAANDNNPLKFSPTVEVALGYLLGQRTRGFMDAESAMRDAFADMCAHQLGVMAGTRAALDHVFKRFSPDMLETRISQGSALDKVFASSRKAKLWDQFCLLYKELVSEAEDDFQTLFGKAFVAAYEEQMARLKPEN